MNSAVSDKRFSLPTQTEANYDPAGGATGRACSNCRFFLRDSWSGQPDACHLIENWPEPIVPNGVCNRHETADADSVLGPPIPVVIVDPDEVGELSLAQLGAQIGASAMKAVRSAVANILKRDSVPFDVFSTSDGKKFWIARHTGKFVDRHKEILADKAHDRYVERVEKGEVDLPELWTLHTPGTKHGKAIAVWKSGGFVLAFGEFDDTVEASNAFEFYRKHRGDIRLSHGFYYNTKDKVDGVFHDYNTFEITTLLDGEEAFPYTSFQEIESMALSKTAQDRIREVGGEGMVQQALAADAKAVTDTKGLESQGVAYKGFENTGDTPAPDAPPSEADKAVIADLTTRLEAAEKALEPFGATEAVKALLELPATVKAQADQIDAQKKLIDGLMDTNKSLQDAASQALDKANGLEKQLAEFMAVAPPASKSGDTILDDAQKSLLDTMIEKSKSVDQKSLVERLVDGQTTVSES